MKNKEKIAGKEIANILIYNAKLPLGKLLNEIFPIDTALALMKLSKMIEQPYQIIEETRKGLIMKYGDKSERGERVEIVPPGSPDGKPASENWDIFVKESNELFGRTTSILCEKVKLPRSVSVKCKHCGKITEKPFEIEPAALLALEPFIEIENKVQPMPSARPDLNIIR